MKSKEEIRATTREKIAKPANYKPHEQLAEWDASLPAGAEDLLERCEPRNDRIVVKLLEEASSSVVFITDRQLLIGGARKALVLKVGPGRWIDGEWWGLEWHPGYRREVAVRPGQTVYVGNWVDLEANGLALCQEGDVRVIVGDGHRFPFIDGRTLYEGKWQS